MDLSSYKLGEIILPEINSITGYLGLLVILLVPLFIALLIARFRSWWASIFFLPAIYGIFYFLVVTIQPLYNWLLSAGNGFGNGMIYGLVYIYLPFDLLHRIILTGLANISSNQFYQNNILFADWFRFVPYLVLFIIFFAIFRKRKKSKKRYDDGF